MKSYCIIVTGLPASGKSTIGKLIAQRLDLPILDKDDYLESLFETKGVGDLKWRQKLSRESDILFIEEAKKHDPVVLVSHWRPPQSDISSGTPTEWLENHYAQIIEVYCDCPAETAAERFIIRVRHPGHRDELKPRDEVFTWLTNYSDNFPLNIGQLETFDTRSTYKIDGLVERLITRRDR